MNKMTLTINNNASPRARIPVARRLTPRTTENQAQSAVFSLKLSLIAAIYTTYKPVFASKKFSQTTQIKSLSRKPHTHTKKLGILPVKLWSAANPSSFIALAGTPPQKHRKLLICETVTLSATH
jgi:hypothetical protein